VFCRWPSEDEGGISVFVDHNLGSRLRDAVLLPIGPEKFRTDIYRRLGSGTALDEIPGADAKARIEEAIANAERVVPPPSSNEWPSNRTFVEWLIGKLPDGGNGYERPVWTDEQRADLASEFVSSRSHRSIGAPGTRSRPSPRICSGSGWTTAPVTRCM
jgi:hypothetical protein